VQGRFYVFIIDEVHMLTNHAFNAMLKTLEEPPPHVKFILATTDPQKIPVTVLSRCLQFNLKQMPAANIVEHLTHILGDEKVEFEPQALRLLARAADGSMRDALSLTDQAIAYSANQVTEEAVRGMLGALDQSYLIRLIDALVASDGAAVLSIADEMALRSLSFSTALQDLAGLFHRIAWAQFAPASVQAEWPEATDLRRFAAELSPEQVQLFYQIATLGRNELGLAPDEYAGFTMTLLRMLAFEPYSGTGSAGSAPASKPAAAGGGARAATPAMASSAASVAAGAAAAVATRASAAEVIPAVETRAAQTEQQAEQSATAPDLSRIAADAASAAKPAGARVVPPWESASEAQADTVEPAPVLAAEAPAPAAMPVQTGPQSRGGSDAFAEPDATPGARGGASGASAALDLLRSKGMRVSADRGARAAAGASAATPAAAPKPAAPRAAVKVPTPDPARRAAAVQEAQARQPARGASVPDDSSAPPWDDIPPDDYVPLGADDAYFTTPDDGFMPVGGNESPEPPRAATPAVSAAAIVDVSQLPPGIALDAIGFAGDWPALAATLPLKGISYQLAFNSELTALDGALLKLSVPVPQYAEASQVAKLKAALAERLGKTVDVAVEVGPARRTAAALDAASRVQRQREAEREIGADPFVQQLIRDFGASIVPGSVRPVAPDAAPGSSQSAH
jgi:DNA polymerase-3 subunit gamma/tau